MEKSWGVFFFFFLIPRNTENILHLNFRRKICPVWGSPDWPCPLISDKITLLISTEQIQPPTLLGLCSGQEVVFLPGQISFSCLNLVRSQGTKSIALIQSALTGKQLSKGTQVKAGDRRWNSMIVFWRACRLWSWVTRLWPTPDLSPQIQSGAKLWLSSEYDVPFYSWNRKISENIHVLVT